eukprot:scaffold7728_cov471-Prasinococcus_capsulatus_cf.AAC.3
MAWTPCQRLADNPGHRRGALQQEGRCHSCSAQGRSPQPDRPRRGGRRGRRGARPVCGRRSCAHGRKFGHRDAQLAAKSLEALRHAAPEEG